MATAVCVRTETELPSCGGVTVAVRDGGEDLQTALDLAYRYGEAYDSYLIAEQQRQLFFSSGRQGVVSFEKWRNNVYVVGGLIAPPEERATLLREFMSFAAERKWNVHFLSVTPEQLPYFREEGFQITKTGEEAIVDLRETTWAGKDFGWVRQQENACRRAGLTFREIVLDDLPGAEAAEIAAELMEVSRLHVANTVYGRELGLMVGRFDPAHMYQKRLFVAEREGRAEAFLVATPSHNGRVWNAETYRRRPTAPRGVVAYLILQMARRLGVEGVEYLSLCQCPALRCDGKSAGSVLVRRSMELWWTTAGWFYDAHRLYHFKSRFRPMYRECFIAAKPGCRFIPMLMFGYLWGVVWPDWKRLPGHMLKRLRNRFRRERLADPRDEDYVRIDALQFGARKPVAANAKAR